MQTVNAEVDGGAFSGLDDFILHLFAHLGNDFFNASGMNAAVSDELMEGETTDFTANGVEGTDDDGFGCVIDDDFHAGGCFERTDVATFASDDATFDFVVVNVENGNAVFNGCFGCDTLDGLNDDALCLFRGSQFGVVHHVVDVTLRFAASFVFHAFDEAVACLIG